MSYKSSDETCGPLSTLGKENSMFVPLSKGEGDLTVYNIDPDMPFGKLEGITSDQIVDDWLEENYPNVSKEYLESNGITVSFKEGREEYKINDELVTEEEYFSLANKDYYRVKEKGNDTFLQHYSVPSSGYGDPWETIGVAHKEIGKIEISISKEKFNETLNLWTSTEMSDEQIDEINAIIKSKSGVEIAIDHGSTVADAIGGINDALKGKYPNATILIVAVSLALNPTMDALDLEDIWSANDGDTIRAVNVLSKIGSITSGLIATTGIGVPIALGFAVLFTAIDIAIEDYDDFDLLKN